MATLRSLTLEIQDIIQDELYNNSLSIRINEAVSVIAGGLRLPDGRFSPPLPELMETEVLVTNSTCFLSLPATYQRDVFQIVDSSGYRIQPAQGGDYYSFALFMRKLSKQDLTETGSIYRVAVRGRRLYYQGIPSSPNSLTVMFYRKPVSMADPDDEPDGIPEQFQSPLIVNKVVAKIIGSRIEDGSGSRKMGSDYHTVQFFQAMVDMVSFVGEDQAPIYYQGTTGIVDGAFCESRWNCLP